MKTYKHLYEDMTNINTILKAIDKASKNKKNRRDVKKVLDNKLFYANRIQTMLYEHSFRPPVYQKHTITEGSRKKERQIEKPHFIYDQMIQNCLITQLSKVILPSLYEHAHGSLDNRGQLQTAKRLYKWIRSDPKGTRYCLQMDIKKCYPSIDQETLIRMYHEKIRDEDFNIENDRIIRSAEKGLAIGAPTSFWHLHFYLTPFDHWLAAQDGVCHYLRHADDMIIFGPNKRKLHRVEQAAIRYLSDHLKLTVKKNHQVFPLEYTDKHGRIRGKPLDICGFLLYREKIILREERALGITRKAHRIGKKEKPTAKDARQMLSQMGWLDHSDTYEMYLIHVKPYIEKRRMRKLVSKAQKKENERRILCSIAS